MCDSLKVQKLTIKPWNQWLLLLAGLTSSVCSYSKTYIGRASIGGYVARERFSDELSGSDKNDFVSMVGRFFILNKNDGENANEFSIDMRDRYSLFDKLNKEQLLLSDRNVFQLTKLYYKINFNRGSLTLGRTSVVDAGGSYVDGIVGDYQVNRNWILGGFDGYNPKPSSQAYVEGNINSTIMGAYLSYQPKNLPWGKNLFLSHAIVSEKFKSEEDRRFLVQTFNYQWSPRNQILENLYLDFVPRSNVQTGSLAWLQGWSSFFETRLNLLGVDVIEYARRQGIRERLDPSPYKEGELDLKFKLGTILGLELGAIHGVRNSDGLKKTEEFIRVKTNREILRQQLLEGKLGVRDNFNSKDTYIQAGWAIYNDKWEFAFDVERTKEVYNNGEILNGNSLSMDLIYLHSKSLFLSGSFQYASDENVNILSTFLRINYRFGNSELPPLRDGASPASRL